MNQEYKMNGSEKFMGVLLILVMALIPLICKVAVVPVSVDEYNVVRSSASVTDVFSYYKSVFIIIFGVVIALAMAFQILGQDGFTVKFKAIPVILVGVMGLLILLSSLFSSAKTVAFKGVSERYEGAFVWLCYIAFFIVAMAFSSNIKRFSWILTGIMISGALVGLIGFGQFFGANIFNSQAFAKFIMGSYYKGQSLNIRFDSVFATLYNPNCASMFFAMMFCAVGIMAVFMPIKNKVKIPLIVLAIILLVALVGTNGAGGFIGTIAGVGISAIVAICYYVFKVKSPKAIIACVIAIVVAIGAVVVFFNTDNKIVAKINIITEALKDGQSLGGSASFYEDVNVEGETATVITKDGNYTIDYAEAGTQLMHNGNVLTPVSTEPMESQKDGKTYTFNESGMTWKMMIYDNNATLVGVDPQGTETYFMFSEVNGKLSMVDRFGTPVDLNVPVESFGFKGVERLGSNRGYIYSRSIPLLKHNIILGAGADNFVLEFPQQDIKSKLEFLGDPYVIIDKPHNMFLQMGINDGCIALLVMIALFVLYVAQTIKRIFTDNNKYLQAVRYGLMAGCIAYMITGLTTDSVVSVAPVFWIMLGAGFGVNMIGNEKQEEKIK